MTQAVPPYHPLGNLVSMIDDPNSAKCWHVFTNNIQRFRTQPGSTYNHQAWQGGYQDHIVETMNLALELYDTLERTGRMGQLPADEQFTRSDALLVLFLHDIEKLWRCVVEDGKLVLNADGRPRVHPEFASKADRQAFAAQKIEEYGFELTPQHRNALKHVEGIRDADYSPHDRVMLPLAAFCHACDLWSARLFYAFPCIGDPWAGRGSCARPPGS